MYSKAATRIIFLGSGCTFKYVQKQNPDLVGKDTSWTLESRPESLPRILKISGFFSGYVKKDMNLES